MITLSANGPVAHIILDDAKRHNALPIAAIHELIEHFNHLDQQPDCCAIMLSATGPSFSAGAVFDEVLEVNRPPNPFTALGDVIEQCRKPVITAIGGNVFGAGAEVALACDFRVMSETAILCFPPVRIGVHYDTGGIDRLRRRFGGQITRRLLLTAEKISADQALNWGLADWVVPADQVLANAMSVAQKFVHFAPLALEGMKQTLVDLEQGAPQDAAEKRLLQCLDSADLREGIEAVKAKRKPQFKRS